MNRRLCSVLAFCFALVLLLGNASSASATTTCAAAWNSTSVYTAGMTASESNINYVANWWTEGNNPATNNGGAGSGEPWTSQGACTSGTSCTTAPGALTVSASGTTSTGTTLSWTTPAEGASCTLTSYEVYQGGVAKAAVAAGTTSYVVTGLTASTAYGFYVAAANSHGTTNSNTLSVTTTASSCASAPGPLTVSVSNTTTTGTTLSWTSPAEGASCTLTGYEVYQGGVAKAAVAAGTTNYAVTGLSSNTTYSFYITATNGYGSTTSNTASATTLLGTCGSAPSAPNGVTSSNTTSTGTTLSWTAVTPPSNCSITSYTVLENGSSIGTTTGTSFTVSGLTASTTYSFAAEATDSKGTSSASTATSVTTLSPSTGNGRVMVGYWHDWETPVWIQLRNVPTSWDIVVVAFANYNGNGQFSFTVDPDETQAQFISDVQYLHGLGKKVLISCGGASETPTFASASDASNFASSVAAMMNQFGFDGVDIDFENGSVYLNQGDFNLANPSSPSVVYLISGLQQLHQALPNAMITMAPIANYVQAGYQFYGSGLYGASNWNGAQLPVINAIRGYLTYVWPQYYNEANIVALDGNYYSEGSEDNLVAMSEMLLKGFTVADGAGTFQPLRADQVVIGVPASASASPGYLPPSSLEAAYNYLITGKNPVGSYVLQTSAGYPDVAGYMVWSINWDVYSNDGSLGSGMHTYLDSLSPIN
jgi:chitinase